jgi:hypothetical protein
MGKQVKNSHIALAEGSPNIQKTLNYNHKTQTRIQLLFKGQLPAPAAMKAETSLKKAKY